MVGLVERARKKEGRRMWREVTAAAARGRRRQRKERVRVLGMTRVMIWFAIVCLCVSDECRNKMKQVE